jgi:hypothetical protein
MRRPTYKDLLFKAREIVKRNDAGIFKEPDLIAAVRSFLTIDVEAELDRRAKAIVDSETKPGSTEPTGQLRLPTLEFYDYEPDRLIRNDNGDMIEQDPAPVDFKFAESARAAKHVREAVQWDERKRKEVELFALWVLEQRTNGRSTKLTFGDFVREAGYFEPRVDSAAA